MADCDGLLVKTASEALKLLVRGRKSIGWFVADAIMSLSPKVPVDCGLAIVGDGSTLDSVSKLNDCSEGGKDGRSDGVRGDRSDGVRDDGRIGTLLNPLISSITDADGRGLMRMSLAVGIGRVEDGNINISGWVAAETGR